MGRNNNLGSEKIGSKKILDEKNCWSQKKIFIRKRKQSQLLDYLTCVGKKFGTKKIFSSKKKSCHIKSLVPKQILESEKNFGQKKILAKKNFGQKKYWSKIVLVNKKKFGQIWSPKHFKFLLTAKIVAMTNFAWQMSHPYIP